MNARDEFLEWWAPDVHSAEPFPLDLTEVEGVVRRYPSKVDADGCSTSDEPTLHSEIEESGSNLFSSEKQPATISMAIINRHPVKLPGKKAVRLQGSSPS